MLMTLWPRQVWWHAFSNAGGGIPSGGGSVVSVTAYLPFSSYLFVLGPENVPIGKY